MRFETKCEKLGITETVNSIIENCECGEINSARIVELSKLRKCEIMEVIGNYLDPQQKFVKDWLDIKQLKTFCRAFEFDEYRCAEFYARAICEEGYEIAYEIDENTVLVLE